VLRRPPQRPKTTRSRGELRVGRHTEAFQATELPDDEKVEVLRAYLKRWKMEVGVFFDGVSADATDSEIRRITPNHPDAPAVGPKG
jgi:hypothetical protein